MTHRQRWRDVWSCNIWRRIWVRGGRGRRRGGVGCVDGCCRFWGLGGRGQRVPVAQGWDVDVLVVVGCYDYSWCALGSVLSESTLTILDILSCTNSLLSISIPNPFPHPTTDSLKHPSRSIPPTTAILFISCTFTILNSFSSGNSLLDRCGNIVIILLGVLDPWGSFDSIIDYRKFVYWVLLRFLWGWG